MDFLKNANSPSDSLKSICRAKLSCYETQEKERTTPCESIRSRRLINRSSNDRPSLCMVMLVVGHNKFICDWAGNCYAMHELSIDTTTMYNIPVAMTLGQLIRPEKKNCVTNGCGHLTVARRHHHHRPLLLMQHQCYALQSASHWARR